MPFPQSFGQRLNMFAMMTNLTTQNVGFFTTSASPVNGTTGTFAGYAAAGSLLIDTDDGSWYVNIGTRLSPIWQGLFLPATAGSGLGSTGVAKMSYDFASHGGAIGTIIPNSSPIVPVGAIILGGVINVTTQLQGAGASIALGLGSGAQLAALKAATAVATWVVGITIPLIPLYTAATYVKVLASAPLSMTISGGALTAGKMDVNVSYVQGN